ncbi:MAG: hypothetical protein A2284_02960 [Deltaproteobacteria bacterium RIFOXYA12_FULL_61_11]|nr:MAG: hypothetical protein A2284_02960 [Deltaproteobacteria bacterium RIFOXYA12_FULL_61_11]
MLLGVLSILVVACIPESTSETLIPSCGDGTCDNAETCTTCPQDCSSSCQSGDSRNTDAVTSQPSEAQGPSTPTITEGVDDLSVPTIEDPSAVSADQSHDVGNGSMTYQDQSNDAPDHSNTDPTSDTCYNHMCEQELGESCTTCPADCGPCQSEPTGGTFPFGLWDMEVNEYQNADFPSVYNAAIPYINYREPSSAIEQLDGYKALGGHMFLNPMQSYSRAKNPDGTFSFDLWKQYVIDPYSDLDFEPYLEDGTLLGLVMIDDIKSGWAEPITPQQIDDMGAYVKAIWPTMPTAARARPDNFNGFSFQYLDIAWAQYASYRGDVGEWIKKQVDLAKQLNLALVAGMNVLDGGDGRSGIPGYSDDTYAMTNEEVMEYGTVILSQPTICAFISWRIDTEYNFPDIHGGMKTLKDVAAAHPFVPCRRRE